MADVGNILNMSAEIDDEQFMKPIFQNSFFQNDHQPNPNLASDYDDEDDVDDDFDEEDEDLFDEEELIDEGYEEDFDFDEEEEDEEEDDEDFAKYN